MPTKRESECCGSTWAEAQTRGFSWRGAGPAAKLSLPRPQTPSSSSVQQQQWRLWGGRRGQPPVCPPLPGPVSPPAPFRPTWPPTQPLALLHTISLKQPALLTPRATRHVKMPRSPGLGAARRPPQTETLTPSPGLRTQTQIAPKSPTTHVTEPRDSTEGNHRPQICRRLGAEPRPEPPRLLSPDTWRPSLPTAHLGPTQSQRLGHTRDHPSSPHHRQTR